jgi:hypothetical protein
LIEIVEMNTPITIQTYARNISAGFFEKLGFIPTNEYLEHPYFARHRITIQKMYFEKERLESSIVETEHE